MRFLGDPARSPDVRERWSGFVQAHVADDRPLPVEPIRCDGFQPEYGYRAALDLLAEPDDVEAIFCANDELASGVYRAAAELGVRIPDDVAVTGWDDVTVAAHLSPPLTTVRQPMRDLGATAARLLFGQVAGRPVDSECLATEVVVRASCGAHGEAVR